MKKIIACFVAFVIFSGGLIAQEKLTYQKPPTEILNLVDAPLAPAVLIDSKGENVVLLYRDAFKSIAELSEPEPRSSSTSTSAASLPPHAADATPKAPKHEISCPVCNRSRLQSCPSVHPRGDDCRFSAPQYTF